MKEADKKKKTRLIVKKGHENILLCITDIAMLFIEDRTVFVMDGNSKKYFLHSTLTEVSEELDENIFFRVNRQTLLNINFIKGFTVMECNKLKVDLTIPHTNTEIVISQETAPLFKTWLCES